MFYFKVKLIGNKAIREYGGEEVVITNPSTWPDKNIIAETSEPFVMGTIITPGLICLSLPHLQRDCMTK